MSSLAQLTERLAARLDLSAVDVETASAHLVESDVPDLEKVNFLRALAAKGETPSEIAAFAKVFRARAIDPGVQMFASEAVDIVGTGGDHAGGFNISTLVVFTLAAAGVTVMKHGNRGITSKCGSADLFAALGVDLQPSQEKLQAALKELNFAFFFAPSFHPSFKHIAPVRKTLAAEGHRTVFNILGPLVNPGRPAHILLGVFSRGWVPKLSQALTELGTRAGLAAHGVITHDRGIDELTTATENVVSGVGALRDVQGSWIPEDSGFRRCSFEELKGGDLQTNVAIAESVVDGRGPQGLADTIVYNAATALWICGRTKTVRDGIQLAREQLVGGGVKRKIAATREFYAS